MKAVLILVFTLVLYSSVNAQTTYYVNDGSLSGDIFTTATGSDANAGTASAPFATLQYAMSKTVNGDIIKIDAGTYNFPGITINKSISILGANYNVNPNATDPYLYNTARNAEAIFTGGPISFGVDNVSVKGLKFMVPGQAITINQVVRQNITVENNFFDITTNGGAYLLFRGPLVQPVTASGLTILNNRFVRSNGSFGSHVVIAAYKNVTLQGNSFLETGSSVLNSFAIQSEQNSTIESSAITGNYFRNVLRAIRIFSGSDLVINKNTLDSAGRGIQFFYGDFPTRRVLIDSNTINDDRQTQPILLRRNTFAYNAGVEDVNITNNVINQGIDGYTGGGGMIQLEFATTGINGTVNVLNNKVRISGNYDNAAPGANQGILIFGNHHLTNIRKNEFLFTAINSRTTNPGNYPPIPTGIYFNTDGGGDFGPIPADAEFNIENNIFNGFKNSIGFYDPKDTGLTTFTGYGGLTQGTKVFIQYNSFLNDSIAVDNGENSYDVSAQCNWWGVFKVQDMLTRFSLKTVSPLPWLVDGTDTDPLTVGFQPVDGTCTGKPPTVVVDEANDATCNGVANGSIKITATGGFGPLQFSWSKENDPAFSSTAEDPVGLAAGKYHLTVTDAYGSTLFLDANGDIDTIDVVLTEPAPTNLAASLTQTAVSCYGGNNGTAAVHATGGTGAYSYLWSNTETTDNASGLAAGPVSVQVTDELGCVTNASTVITQPDQPISITLTGTSASCNGSISSSVTGGTGAYTYLWSNGATTSSISSIPSGTYTLTVTDANLCSTSSSLTITGNATLNPSVQVTDLTCAGGANGILAVTNVNGVAPYLYNLNGGTFQSSNIFTGLAAGSYVVGVKDAGGCADFVTKIVSEPAPLVVTLDRVLTPCYGTGDGRIYILASGGTGGLTYSWTGPNGFTSTTQNPNKLFAGQYTVVVTDANGCNKSLQVDLPSQPQITVNGAVTNILCRGDISGAIDLTLGGGTGAGFTVQWIGPNTFTSASEDITGLFAGSYTATVTDLGSGCVTSKTFTITQPATSLSLSLTKTNATGCSSLGTISATGAGGTAPYKYSLDNITYQTSGNFTGLYGATYTVWVKDANGCATSKAQAITDNGSDEFESNNSKSQAKQISVGATINARIALATDVADWFKFTTSSAGSYVLTLTHPSASFTYNIYPVANNAPALVPASTTATTKTYALAAGTTYYVSVTGGLSYVCYSLSIAPVLGAVRVPIPAVSDEMTMKTTVYPNPHQGAFRLRIVSGQTGDGQLLLINNTGQVIAVRKLNLVKGVETIVNFNGIKEGVLYYKVIAGKEVQTGKIIGASR